MNCTCSQQGDYCSEHPSCACGCQRHAHSGGGIGDCIAGKTTCHGCPEYRPAKLSKFDELDDSDIDAIGTEDMWRIKDAYRELRAHHIEETTALWNKRKEVDSPMRFYEYMLDIRGIEIAEDICPTCKGYGVKMYSSGATWRGGMGGASMARDVCDACWGSGDKSRPWPNRRTMRDDMNKLVAEFAVDALAKSCGATMTTAKPSIQQIIEHLDAFMKKRKVSDIWTKPLAEGLANILRRAIGEPETKRFR